MSFRGLIANIFSQNELCELDAAFVTESQRIYNSLAHDGGDDYEWVPTAWLKAWLQLQPTGVPLSPIDEPPATKLDVFDVAGLLCEHNR